MVSSEKRPGGRVVAVKIADTGPGISEEALRKVFDPYFTTKPAGLGMGLMICRNIIETHGGTLRHLSTRTGTSFRFTLRTKE